MTPRWQQETMTLKFYSFNEALSPGSVRLTIAEKKINDVEVVNINLARGENFSPEYLRINQNGTVPSLVNTETQQILDDSIPITEYLNKNYPGTDLLPSSDQPVIDHWVKEAHTIDGNFLLFSPADAADMEQKRGFIEGFFGGRIKALTEFRQKQDSPFYKQKMTELQTIMGAYEHPEKAQPLYEGHKKEWQKAELFLNKLETQLVGPYIIGDKYSLADVHVIPLLVRLKAVKGDAVFEGRPKLAKYMATVAARDNYKAVYGE